MVMDSNLDGPKLTLFLLTIFFYAKASMLKELPCLISLVYELIVCLYAYKP